METELAYFVALHEIGLVVLQLGSFDEPSSDERPSRLYLNEGAVWEWAPQEAIESRSEDAAEKIRVFLLSDDPGEGQQEALARVARKVPRAAHTSDLTQALTDRRDAGTCALTSLVLSESLWMILE